MKLARALRREGRIQEDLDQLRHQLEATLTAQYPPTPPGSPIILSLAKRFANTAQISNGKLPESASDMLLQRRISDSPSSPSNEGRVIGRYDDVNVAQSVSTINCVPPAPRTATKLIGLALEHAHPPPIWGESIESSTIVDSELSSTYEYPRFFTRDPTQPLTDDSEDSSTTRFHLVQRMETTLKHVQGDYWKCPMNANINAGKSISETGFLAIGVIGEVSDDERQHEKEPKRISTRGSKPKSNKGSASAHRGETTTNISFQPSATPKSVWSEPSASTMHVRGKTYAKDGIKVESEASIFSVLGVDSFVSGDKCEAVDVSAGTKSYLHRWSGVCEELGLSHPPFLLVVNFIVPWGNFQAYLVRPDADEGPFSSRHRNRPSEKAWRKFVEGSTEYRNERLKLIPRIVAGPWMVKKVVGSTPALIGTKLPVSYRGSVAENYIEIILDVTKGPAFGNSVANTVVGKADLVTVDLGFVIEGQGEDGHLPEQMLGLIRFHHLNMAKAPTRSQWTRKVM